MRIMLITTLFLLLTACSPATAGEPGAGEADPFDIAVAQYIMDTAGFHDIDEALNETNQVDPAQLSIVRRVDKVLSNVAWPAELEAPANDFLALLDELAAALEADNGEEAARLAAEAHEAQHEFTHTIDEWLGEGEHDEE